MWNFYIFIMCNIICESFICLFYPVVMILKIVLKSILYCNTVLRLPKYELLIIIIIIIIIIILIIIRRIVGKKSLLFYFVTKSKFLCFVLQRILPLYYWSTALWLKSIRDIAWCSFCNYPRQYFSPLIITHLGSFITW